MSEARLLDNQIRAMMARRNALDRRAAIPPGTLTTETTTELGKQVTRFYGDAAATWRPFMPPVRNKITGFNR
ncbi:MAG: hypothetical protein PHU07_13200 [Acidocella sp.]|nr:hypothetical protein [Acidocella sp.]